MVLLIFGVRFQLLSHYKNSILLYIVGSDITSLAKDKLYTHINLEEMTIHQVSALFLVKRITFTEALS